MDLSSLAGIHRHCETLWKNMEHGRVLHRLTETGDAFLVVLPADHFRVFAFVHVGPQGGAQGTLVIQDTQQQIGADQVSVYSCGAGGVAGLFGLPRRYRRSRADMVSEARDRMESLIREATQPGSGFIERVASHSNGSSPSRSISALEGGAPGLGR